MIDYQEELEQYKERIDELATQKRYAELRDLFLPMEPADIALLLEEGKQEQMPLLYRLLPKETAAEVFVELEPESQEMLINGFSNTELTEVLDELYLDDAVDIVEEMPASVVIRILDKATPEMRKSINEILKYPEDSTGSIMTTEYVDLKATMTVLDALKRIRRTGVDKETIPTQKNDLYVNHLNVSRDVRNRWTPTNPRTDGYPRLIDAYAGRLVDQNGHYITDDQPSSSTITNCTLLEDVSYLKIGSISLIYSFPEDWIRKLHLSSMSVSFTVNNIYTFTNYSGIDPETPGAVYPQSRAFSFGLSLGF